MADPAPMPDYLSREQALAWAMFGDPAKVANADGSWWTRAGNRVFGPSPRVNENAFLTELRRGRIVAHWRSPGRQLQSVERWRWDLVDQLSALPTDGGEIVFKKSDMLKKYVPLAPVHPKDSQRSRAAMVKVGDNTLELAVRKYLATPGNEEAPFRAVREAMNDEFEGKKVGRDQLADIVNRIRPRGPGRRKSPAAQSEKSTGK